MLHPSGRSSPGFLNQIILNHIPDQTRRILHLGLVENILSMGINGPLTNEEFLCDFIIG